MKRLLFVSGLVGVLLNAFNVAAAEQPVRGGRLNMLVHPEPSTLIYGLSQLGEVQAVAGKMYEGLLTYDFDLTPRPVLARSWTISQDGLTYTFHLQEGVKWHDGKPFTADDVIFTATEFLPEVSPRARATFGLVKAARALDSQTVEFTLKEPYPPFLIALNVQNVPMMPAHIYRGTDYRNNPMNHSPVGTGPFKLKEWRRGQYIHLARNQEYWQAGKPYLDEIFVHIIPDAAARAAAYETGIVDVVRAGYVEYSDLDRLARLPGSTIERRGNELTLPIAWLMFNLQRQPFDDVRFRRAIYHALDREFIKDAIFFGHVEVATGPIATSSPFYEPNVRRYDFNLAKARTLLDEMGLRPSANGMRTSIELIAQELVAFRRLSEYIKQQLAKVGIEVRIVNVDNANWAKRVGEFEFDTGINWLSQLGDPAIGVSRNYHSKNVVRGSPFGNNVHYGNTKVDELFEKAAVAIDLTERKRLYSEVQKLLVDDVPVAWIAEMYLPMVYRAKFKDLVKSTYQYFDSFADAYVTP